MASRNDNQFAFLTGYIGACCETLVEQDLLPNIKDEVTRIAKEIDDLLWDVARLVSPDLKKIKEWMTSINQKIEKDEITAREVIAFGHLISSDLLGEISDQKKREVVNKIFQKINELDDILDPEGDDHDAYHNAENFLTVVYKEIGFVPEGRFQEQLNKLKRRSQRYAAGRR